MNILSSLGEIILNYIAPQQAINVASTGLIGAEKDMPESLKAIR